MHWIEITTTGLRFEPSTDIARLRRRLRFYPPAQVVSGRTHYLDSYVAPKMVR